MYQLCGSYLNDGTFGKYMERKEGGHSRYELKCQNVALASQILRTIPLNEVPSSKLPTMNAFYRTVTTSVTR
jgi:hypothetical protein